MKFSIGQGGQSLVEIVLAMGLSAILLPALLTGLVSSRQGKVQQSQRTQAVYLLNETVDAVRSVREKGWTGFAVNGTFHPAISGSSWTLIPGATVSAGLTEQVVIGNVNRDPAGAIVTSGGTLDPSSKKADISIFWGQTYLSTVSASLFITRYLDNNSFTQTTVADFNVGTKSGTIITNTAGGEVTLGAGGHGDWCAPNLSLAALDLPKSGIANALTAIEGRAFAGTGDNASGVAFASINITTSYPPVASIAGTYEPPPPPIKTNGIFGETNYAYLATDNNSKEVIIISLTQYSDPPTNSKYKEVGSINLPGNVNANSIFVINNKAYVLSSDSKFYIYSLSSDRTSATLQNSGGLTISGVGKKVLVAGNYAYVATGATSNQFQIIDIFTNPSNPTIVNSPGLTLGTSQAGVDAYVSTNIGNPQIAYFATSYSSGKPNLFVIDISSKTNPHLPLGYVGYSTNGMSPKGLTAVTNNKVIIVGTGGVEYQVLDVSTASNPVTCGPGLNIDTGVNGVSSVIQQNGDVFSYIITGDSNSEFKMIEGGPGGSYVTSGDFTSSYFSWIFFPTAFNKFDVSVNRPTSTDVKFQVAVSQAIGGSCSAAIFNFVGPDSTSSTFFTTSETSGNQAFSFAIPPNINPGNCFKYKVFFSTTAPTSNPIFNDIIVNYSP